MGMGKELRLEMTEWGILIMVTVVLAVVLLKMRVSDSVACPSAWPNYNSTLASTEACYANTSMASNTSVRALYTDVGTYVDAIQEPKNWLVIVIIGLIGMGLIKYWKGSDKD